VRAVLTKTKSIRAERRAQAEKRQKVRADRSPEQQLEWLDQKFGTGKGATRERIRLLEQIKQAAPKATPKAAAKKETPAKPARKGTSQKETSQKETK